MPRQHPGDHFGHGLIAISLISAYACPVHAHARASRWAPSDRHPARTRSSPAPSRRAHFAYPCAGHAEQAPRNPPEKPASPTRAGPRNRWSGACTPERGARLTSGCSGGGSGPSGDHRVTDPPKALVEGSALCRRLGSCPAQCHPIGLGPEKLAAVSGLALPFTTQRSSPIGASLAAPNGPSATGRRPAERRPGHR